MLHVCGGDQFAVGWRGELDPLLTFTELNRKNLVICALIIFFFKLKKMITSGCNVYYTTPLLVQSAISEYVAITPRVV